MIKPKAPKDGTPAEFVAEFEKRHGRPYDCTMTAIINTMKEMLNEPAPNPFTPDQLAWMREEQRNGYKWAACDGEGLIYIFSIKPHKVLNEVEYYGGWDITDREVDNGEFVECTGRKQFLEDKLSWDDQEPLCFADYAPLEGAVE